mgnify:CR=1 FL=1
MKFVDENAEVEYFVRITGKVDTTASGTLSKDQYESGSIDDEDIYELFWNDDDRDIDYNSITKTDVDYQHEQLSL